MIEKKDIFDKIMELPILKIFNPFYKKNKEVLLYLFFGGLTFCVSIASYAYFNLVLDFNELVANVFSWILAVLFAYITNKIWVFQAPVSSIRDFLKQIFSFFGGRLATLGVEEVILFVFITCLNWNSMIVKVVAQIVVIFLNYIISKLWVFK